MKPIIGVVSRPSITLKKNKCHTIDENIKNAIIHCGGIPIVIIPPQEYNFCDISPKDLPKLTEENKEDIDRILKLCDGILFPGGNKIYEYDYYICDYAKQKNIPVLGICAGMQLLARSGSNNYNEKIDKDNHNLDDNLTHKITIKKDTLLHKILNIDELYVNSYHHYKIHDEGINVASATSDDGVIEAIENSNYRFYLGLQWHPEKLMDEYNEKIITYFINESKK